MTSKKKLRRKLARKRAEVRNLRARLDFFGRRLEEAVRDRDEAAACGVCGSKRGATIGWIRGGRCLPCREGR